MTRQIRTARGKIVPDYREFYSFQTIDGRSVTTKADNESEARVRIEKTLKVQLKEAA